MLIIYYAILYYNILYYNVLALQRAAAAPFGTQRAFLLAQLFVLLVLLCCIEC